MILLLLLLLHFGASKPLNCAISGDYLNVSLVRVLEDRLIYVPKKLQSIPSLAASTTTRKEVTDKNNKMQTMVDMTNVFGSQKQKKLEKTRMQCAV